MLELLAGVRREGQLDEIAVDDIAEDDQPERHQDDRLDHRHGEIFFALVARAVDLGELLEGLGQHALFLGDQDQFAGVGIEHAIASQRFADHIAALEQRLTQSTDGFLVEILTLEDVEDARITDAALQPVGECRTHLLGLRVGHIGRPLPDDGVDFGCGVLRCMKIGCIVVMRGSAMVHRRVAMFDIKMRRESLTESTVE